MWAEPKKTERGKAYYARFQAWLEENGITQHPDAFVGRPGRSLVLIPKALQPHADRVDETVYTFVGACQGDRAAAGRVDAARRTRRRCAGLAGLRLHQAARLLPRLRRAFGVLPGWHVVLQIGKHVDPAELGDVPANVEVHSWVPQLACCGRPTPSSPTRAPAAARRGWPRPRRWSPYRRPWTSSATPTCSRRSVWPGTCRRRRPRRDPAGGRPRARRRPRGRPPAQGGRARDGDGGRHRRAADLIEAELRAGVAVSGGHEVRAR